MVLGAYAALGEQYANELKRLSSFDDTLLKPAFDIGPELRFRSTKAHTVETPPLGV